LSQERTRRFRIEAQASFAAGIVSLLLAIEVLREEAMDTARTLLYAVAIGAAVAEVAWALYYWPLAPVQPALLLGLLAHLAIQAVVAHVRKHLSGRRAAEYSVVAAFGLAAVLLLS